MNFRKAIVPSAFVVAGMTAMFFQPASNASPQESESSAVSVADLDETGSSKGDKGKTADEKNVSNPSNKGEESTKETAPKLKGVESGTPNNEDKASPSETDLDAKVTKGAVTQSNSSMIREGATPQKIDLAKFNVAPEPEPESAPSVPETTVEAATTPATAQGPAPIYNANTGNAVVDAALSQVGTPYVWGGTQPGGFDCSGLTSWAYAQAGKSIPRTSGAQWSAGQAVSVDDMQPGDIVVSYGGGHVGIYIGNGQMVHAPTTGDVVKVSPLQPIDGVVRF